MVAKKNVKVGHKIILKVQKLTNKLKDINIYQYLFIFKAHDFEVPDA